MQPELATEVENIKGQIGLIWIALLLMGIGDAVGMYNNYRRDVKWRAHDYRINQIETKLRMEPESYANR